VEIAQINKIILDLDKDSKIQSAVLSDGFLIWGRLRYGIFRLLLNQTQSNPSSTNNLNFRNSIPSNSLSKIKAVFQTIRLLLFGINWFVGKVDGICINGSKIRKAGKSNLFVGKSNLAFYHIENIKLLSVFNYEKDIDFNKYLGKTSYIDSMVTLSKLISIFKKKKIESDYLAIEEVFVVIKNKFIELNLNPDDLIPNHKECKRYLRFHYHLGWLFQISFGRLKPKFLVIEDGNYGGGNSSLIIKTANNLGIKTIEMQHGVFDVAFFYEESLMSLKSFEIQKTKFVFTFGKYWTDWVSIPGKAIEIGSVLLAEELNKPQKKDDDQLNTILFCSQGSNNQILLETAAQLSVLVAATYKVIYKLHPKEYELIESYQSNFIQYPNLQFLSNVNTYDLLKQSTFVVGSFSTLLFESLYFKNTPFVLSDRYSIEYIPENVGLRFSNVKELFDLIQLHAVKEVNANDYWEFDWRSNMLEVGKNENLW
jgi:hypothetical protein